MEKSLEASKVQLGTVMLEEMRERILIWLDSHIDSVSGAHVLGVTADRHFTHCAVKGSRDGYEEGFTDEIVGMLARGSATMGALVEKTENHLSVGLCAGGITEIWNAPISDGAIGELVVMVGSPDSPECDAVWTGLAVRDSLRETDRRGRPHRASAAPRVH